MIKRLVFIALTLIILGFLGCGGGNGGGGSSIPTELIASDTKAVFSQDNTGTKVVLYFNSNTLSNLSQEGVDPTNVIWIQWNSDIVGWKDVSVLHSPLQKDENGKWLAVLEGMPSGDIGNFSLKLNDGSYVWTGLPFWEIEGIDFKILENGLLSYGVIKKPSITFSENSVRIDFNSIFLTNLSNQGVDPVGVNQIQWNSDAVGWNEYSTVYSQLQRDDIGNWFAVLEGMPDNDTGNFSLRLADNSYVWTGLPFWEITGKKVTLLDNDLMYYE